MKESRTALGVAWMRALHQLFDDPPLILEDRPILELLGPGAAAGAEKMRERMQEVGPRMLRAHVVLRSRFTEDRLHESLARGVSQFVILGAGYDTFFARQPDWARSLRIFEIDQPATQQDKLAKIAAAKIDIPANVTFGSVNFEAESLGDGLRRHGVDPGRPTLFSWLGVTMYLTEPAIDATLAAVRAFPRGSEIVLTFATRQSDGSPQASLAAVVASMGEPWVTYYEPSEIETRLLAAGFAQVELLIPKQAETRYFAHRRDLPVPARASIVSARV